MTETSNDPPSMPTSSTNDPQTTRSDSMEPPTASEVVQIPKPHIPIMIKTETDSGAVEPSDEDDDDEDNRSTPERDTSMMPVRVKAEPREADTNSKEPISNPTTPAETATTATTTIAPTNIKPEPTTASTNDETLPDELIDELLTTVDELANEDINNILPITTTTSTTTTTATEATSTPTIRVKSEMNLKSELPEVPDKIPDDFFDDLLPDPSQEQPHVPMIVEDLETKYAERLRELKELKQLEKEAHKSKKKKKKNKKEKSKDKEKEKDKESKSHKRKHDEISGHMENEQERRERCYDNLPSTSNNYRSNNKLNSFRVKSEFRRRSPLPMETTELECLPVQGATAERNSGFKRIKLEKRISTEPTANVALTPQEKRVNAIQRAITAMNLCAKTPPLVPGNSSITPLEHFDYTSTVRKLPASNSHLTAEIYENRSPLHTVHNVSYKFSSSNTRMNLREWGLESMPEAVRKLATLLAYDANSLHRKLRTIKIPGKLQQKDDNSKSETMQMSDEIQSTYYTNAETQTDPVRVMSVNDKQRKHDIGVQAKVAVGSIGSQTTTVAALQMNGNTPLQRMFDTLNEHQQLAVLDFAELIRESANSVLDMYQLRQRMLAIYNSAQVTKTTPAPTMPPSMPRPVLAQHPSDPRQRAGIVPTPTMNYPPQQMMLPHPAHNMGVAHAYAQQQQPQSAPPPHPNNMHYFQRY